MILFLFYMYLLIVRMLVYILFNIVINKLNLYMYFVIVIDFDYF